MSTKKISYHLKTRIPEKLIYDLLTYVGENPDREGLKETPKRVVEMYEELLSGYKHNPKAIFKTFSSNGYHELITVSNIDFYSLCEHHLVPFFGKIHIGYIPNSRILGLSKFGRLVEVFSRRLQTQENLTQQIANTLKQNLQPLGYIVHTEAEHLCISMRGVRKHGFLIRTTIKNGIMNTRNDLVEQFFRDIKKMEGKQ